MATSFTPAAVAVQRLSLDEPQKLAIEVGDVATKPTDPSEFNVIETNEKFVQERYAGELSGALGSGEVNRRRTVYYFDTYRGVETTSADLPVIYGFSVRLALTITSDDADLKLGGLPWIAAEAQLGRTTAATQVSIQGWGGEFTPKLTPSFNVDSYPEVMEYFQDVVETVFKDSNKAHLKPKVLFVTKEETNHERDFRWAAGTTFALDSIADGRNLATAITRSEWPVDTPEVAAMIDTYRHSLETADRDQRPDDVQRRQAASLLGNMRITNRGMAG